MQLRLADLWEAGASRRPLESKEEEACDELEATQSSAGSASSEGSSTSSQLATLAHFVLTLQDVVEKFYAREIFDIFVNHSYFTAAVLASASTSLRRSLVSTGIQPLLRRDLLARCAKTLRSVVRAPHIDPDQIRVLCSRHGLKALVEELCVALSSDLRRADERHGVHILAAFVEGGGDLGLSLPPECIRRLRLVHAQPGDTLLGWLLHWEAALLDEELTRATLRSFVRGICFFFPRSRSQHKCQGATCACGFGASPSPPLKRRRR
mmetsp:Transcript_95468/g.279183  ORF Transcript_95468/g.279183 Transcript_95468/m.279183 type:complete len:266 (-) Transcript_95468:107-904(-)